MRAIVANAPRIPAEYLPVPQPGVQAGLGDLPAGGAIGQVNVNRGPDKCTPMCDPFALLKRGGKRWPRPQVVERVALGIPSGGGPNVIQPSPEYDYPDTPAKEPKPNEEPPADRDAGHQPEILGNP